MSWGYHMWKHTKDPKYISLPVNVDTMKAIKDKNIDINNSTKNKKSDETKTDKATDDMKNVSLDTTNSNTNQKESTKINNDNMELQKLSVAGKSSLAKTNCSHLADKQLNPPDAHATSYSQISQPLCLQTSIRKPIPTENEIKPLNMQIVNS